MNTPSTTVPSVHNYSTRSVTKRRQPFRQIIESQRTPDSQVSLPFTEVIDPSNIPTSYSVPDINGNMHIYFHMDHIGHLFLNEVRKIGRDIRNEVQLEFNEMKQCLMEHNKSQLNQINKRLDSITNHKTYKAPNQISNRIKKERVRDISRKADAQLDAEGKLILVERLLNEDQDAKDLFVSSSSKAVVLIKKQEIDRLSKSIGCPIIIIYISQVSIIYSC